QIKLGGVSYKCHFKKRSSEEKEDGCADTYDLELTDPSSSDEKEPNTILPLTKYTVSQKKKMLARTKFFIRKNPKTNQYGLGVTLNHESKAVEIGGPDKINLYTSHITHLGLLIKELEKGRAKKSVMLAALATGSGKSFIQALWMLVLYCADVKGVFTAPSALVAQLYQDIGRLLPKTVTQAIAQPG